MNSKNNSGESLLRLDLQQTLKRSPINPKDLTSFQRILLTTDGMVTEILEAFFWEGMKVIKLYQDNFATDHDIPSLELKKGSNIMHRKIFLRGRLSQRNHLYGETIIVPDRLDERIKDGLLNSNKPIGLLIFENRLETFREILDSGKEKANDLAADFNIEKDDFLIFRTYRILAKGLPIMLITEKFLEKGMETE